MQERYIATVDLGSSKIALCVAKVSGLDTQVIYYRETPSDGIRYSCVFNPKRAAKSLREAILTAEDELKIRILQVVVGLPRYGVRQEIARAEIERTDPDACITEEEIEIVKEQAQDTYPLKDESREEIYGAVAQSFSADDMMGSEEDVVGTTADTLTGNFKVFVGAKKALSNIDIMMNELGIAAARKYFLPQSTAEAVLTEDEKDNGVALVELGAGVTSLTIYEGGIMRHYSSIPFGGKTVTTDIKYECAFNESLAENIKLAFGACMPEKLQTLSEKILQINDEETGSYEHLPVKYLSEIITCRCKEIIDAILYNVQESHFADRLRSGIVITGGSANLVNVASLIKEMSGYNVRIGFPRTKSFITDGCNGVCETGAAASVGMVMLAAADQHLNCIEEMVEEEEPSETQPAVTEPAVETVPEKEPDYTDTVFSTVEPEIKPKPAPRATRTRTPKKPRPALNIRWVSKAGELMDRMSKDLGGLFDMTVGGFYDDMDNEKEK